jgi:putative DNA primase/helicase
MTADTLTVLHSVNRLHATKRFTLHPGKKGRPDRLSSQSYGKERYFRIESIAIDGFDALCRALDKLTRSPFAFVVRGQPLPDTNLKYCRRLLHPDRKTGDAATFIATARHWFAVDLDHLPAPPLTDAASDPEAAIEHLIGRLPPELADTSCWWQLTSSQNLPGHEDTLSARLWYWSAVPLADAELKRWGASATRHGKVVDTALYSGVQAHYIAAPVFSGMNDPLPRRTGIRLGLEDEALLIIPPPDAKNPEVASSAGYTPGHGVEFFLDQLGPNAHNREHIRSAIASYVALYGAQAAVQPLYARIREKLDARVPGWRADPRGDRYADDAHLDEITDWVRRIHGDQPPKPPPVPEPPDREEPPPLEPDDQLQPPPPRPILRLVNGELPFAIDRAEELLLAADCKLYAYGDQLVRTAPRTIRVADPEKQVVGLRLVPVAAAHMAERFSRIIDFQKYNAKRKEWSSVNCPHDLAVTYLERVGSWQLPQLSALTTCPLLLADGRILDRPGFDPASGVLFDPQGVEFPPIPAAPSHAEAKAAFARLAAPFAEFPFVDECSKSVLWSALLSAVARLALPFVPCHGFDAPAAGTGKSKLVDCVSIVLTGRECAVVTQPDDEVEFEKKLGALMLAGDPIISIDNCTRAIDNPFLCILITQPEAQVRILGMSKTATVPNTALVCVTGNNSSFGGDMLRRGLMARLDAKVERPELRSFNGEDPITWVKRERRQFVIDALMVLRGYASAGYPDPPAALGGFEAWSRLIRGALLWLDEPDPLDRLESARAGDPAYQRLEAVITAWDTVLGERSATTREIIAEAAVFVFSPTHSNPNHITYTHPGFRHALLDVAGERGQISAQRLGKWLGANKDRVVGNHRLAEAALLDGNRRWQLQRRDDEGRWQ